MDWFLDGSSLRHEMLIKKDNIASIYLKKCASDFINSVGHI